MIQFHQVNKNYNGNEFQINDLNFTVDPGEFVFLIGPSGSGKTTVIKMLIREELPSEGKIFFDDFDITRLTRSSVYRLRRQIGVVFQDYKLIPDKTVYENVAFAMEVAGKKDREIRETVPYLLEVVGLANRQRAFPAHLSGGEKQRVAIARAVANNPRVLIADEPTGNLDPAAAWDIVQILTKINNWGTTVIMSTHGTDIVNTLNKRVIQMQDGVIVRDDKHGFYEKVEGEKAKGKKGVDTFTLSRKGDIKVSFSNNKTSEDKEKKPSFLSRIWPFGKRENAEVEAALEEQSEEVVDIDVVEAFSVEQLERLAADAHKLKLETLKLDNNLLKRLHAAGYKIISDLLDAGPEKLASEQMIDQEDILIVATAVEEFLEAEKQKIIEEEPKSTTATKATPAKKKIKLAIKKK
jgi:cell division transport system ATP-binding protein